MISRDFYLQKLIRKLGNGDIKVITGLRRCGKSVLLFELFPKYLRQRGIGDDQLIQIQLDQRRHYQYRNPIALCAYVEALVTAKPEQSFYLFIDEVQLTSKVVDRDNGGLEVTIYDLLNELKGYRNLDVYVTGSNSKGLSRDIATEFRGRADQIHLYPLSFQEFYSAVGGDEERALDEYLLYGGLPRLTSIADKGDKKEYLQNLFRELYIRDIVERNGSRREELLGAILDFLASGIGSLTNPSKIAAALSASRRERINPALVADYLGYIEDSFLVSQARRYDVKGKAYFKFPSKYYYTDLGLRNARLNYRQYDPGHLMENVIYNELLRRGYSVDVGVVADRSQGGNVQREIDFVVNETDKRLYIQAALRLEGEEKAAREVGPLLLAKDFFKKVIIRRDLPYSHYDANGIFHCNLLDFLLERVELF